jgi:hypothetical protein
MRSRDGSVVGERVGVICADDTGRVRVDGYAL